jgi:hypothetical protein
MHWYDIVESICSIACAPCAEFTQRSHRTSTRQRQGTKRSTLNTSKHIRMTSASYVFILVTSTRASVKKNKVDTALA